MVNLENAGRQMRDSCTRAEKTCNL